MKPVPVVESPRRLAAAADPPTPCGDRCDEACDVEVIHGDAVAAARAALPTPREQRRLAEVFAAFANPTRLGLLAALRARLGATAPELCVCDLVAVVGASQSMTSHQLGALRAAGLVASRRDGRLVYYRLADGAAPLLDDALAYVRATLPASEPRARAARTTAANGARPRTPAAREAAGRGAHGGVR